MIVNIDEKVPRRKILDFDKKEKKMSRGSIWYNKLKTDPIRFAQYQAKKKEYHRLKQARSSAAITRRAGKIQKKKIPKTRRFQETENGSNRKVRLHYKTQKRNFKKRRAAAVAASVITTTHEDLISGIINQLFSIEWSDTELSEVWTVLQALRSLKSRR